MIPLFDLHCDTLEEMYLGNYSLSSSPLHISLDKCEELSPYIQVMAVWSDYRLTPAEAYDRYLNTIDYANRQGIKFIKEYKNFILIEHPEGYRECMNKHDLGLIKERVKPPKSDLNVEKVKI